MISDNAAMITHRMGEDRICSTFMAILYQHFYRRPPIFLRGIVVLLGRLQPPSAENLVGGPHAYLKAVRKLRCGL